MLVTYGLMVVDNKDDFFWDVVQYLYPITCLPYCQWSGKTLNYRTAYCSLSIHQGLRLNGRNGIYFIEE